jgi:hypothetical protein
VSAASRSLAMRRIGAVLAGFFAVFVLSVGTDAVLHAAGVFPPQDERMSDGLFLLATSYRVLFTILGGYLAARLAPDAPMRHALLLGVLGAAAAAAGLVATWNAGSEFGPKWYPLALVVTAIPCCWAGGRLFLSRAGATTWEQDLGSRI